MQLVPLRNQPRQALATNLGGQSVTLGVVWLPLPEAWYLTLAVPDETRGTGRRPIVVNRQLTPWTRIIGAAPGRAPDVATEQDAPFAGDLIIYPRGPSYFDADIGREAWVETHGLFYFTETELALEPVIRAALEAAAGL